ncbi:MAG TPA: branched-chain amino acid ABC transporter permease [Anaerolineaceae bacterium]
MATLQEHPTRSAKPASAPLLTRVGRALRKESGMLIIFVLLGLFPFIFGVLSGEGAQSGPARFWQGQLIAFFIMGVYAMSYDLLFGYTGILSFGQAAFFGVGAYTMALFFKHAAPAIASQYQVFLPGGVNITDAVLMIMAVLLVMVVGVLMGLLFSAVSLRVRGVYYTMITLAMAEAFYILSKTTDLIQWTGADEGLHGVDFPAWINPTQNRLLFYYVAFVFLLLSFLFLRRIVSSPTGRVFIALRENENRVRRIGYNPSVYRGLAFVISALAASLAGALYSIWNIGATPSMVSTTTTVNALIMVIMGGMGTLSGPILGAGLMQVLGQFLYQWFGQRWPLVFGLFFIALVMFLPYGIIGTLRQRSSSAGRGWKQLVGMVSGKKEE